jgi:hypothetical protein
LLRDEPQRRALGQAARTRLDTALSWQVSSQRLVALMDGLVGTLPPPLGIPAPLHLDKTSLGEHQED